MVNLIKIGAKTGYALGAAVVAIIGSIFGYHWYRGRQEGKSHPRAAMDAAKKTADVVVNVAEKAAKVKTAHDKFVR